MIALYLVSQIFEIPDGKKGSSWVQLKDKLGNFSSFPKQVFATLSQSVSVQSSCADNNTAVQSSGILFLLFECVMLF